MAGFITPVLIGSLYFLCCVQVCLGYNIDVDHIRVFKGKSGSLFGYTTLLEKTGTGYNLVVGAPKANSSYRTGTGSIYTCDVREEASCSRQYWIRNEDLPDIADSGTWYNDDEMFGSVLSQTVNNILVVCAPKYNDLSYETQGFPFLIGRCVLNRSEEVRPLFKHNAGNYFRKLTVAVQNSKSIYWNGMGQSGLSGDVLADGSILLGTPGFAEWRGGVVMMKPFPQQFETDSDIQHYSYIGYAVASGSFCGKNNLCFVTGGPRKDGGKVFLYLYTPVIEKLTQLQILEGDQTGSYFGASLCAADVNGDDIDDLLVGAPFFSDSASEDNSKKIHMDEGRVTVYVNRKSSDNKLHLEKSIVLQGSNEASARFGTAIANIGDVNRDGCHDVAVGAPYEDEGRGVVYIYHGSEDGLQPEVKQRILGRDIRDDAWSFGWSISRSADVDDNKYPDFSVGNYLSDTAVIIRTRPIVTSHVSMTTDPTLIVRDKTSCPSHLDSEGCFRLFIDFGYSGVSLPRELRYNYSLKIDTYKSVSQKRVQLEVTEDKFSYSHTSQLVVTQSTGQRVDFWVKTIENLRDLDPFTIVRFEVEYNLMLPNSSSDILPIADAEQSNRVIKDIAFQLACGDDNECWSDLILEVNSRVNHETDEFIRSELEDEIVVNATETVVLDVDVTNAGEDAFATVIYVSWTGTVNLQTTESDPQQPVICKEEVEDVNSMTKSVECNVILPVKAESQFGFRMFFPTNEISTQWSNVNFSISIRSESNETNPADNVVNDTTSVWIDAQTKLNGNAKPEETVVPEENRDKSFVNMLHKYVIRNDGPSFLPETVATVMLPYYKPDNDLSGDGILAKDAYVSIIQDDGYTIECTSGADREALKQNQTTTPMPEATTSGNGGQTSPFLPPIIPAKVVEMPQSPIVMEGINTVYLMDCREYRCEEFECPLSHLPPGTSAVVDVSLKIRASDLPFQAADNINYLRFITEVKVQQPSHPLLYPWTTKVDKTLSTRLYQPTIQAKVNIWIIIGSVIAGIILLIIILVILIKCGFFKRKKKGEIQKWKRESGYYRRQEGARRSAVPSTSTPPENGKH